MLHIACPDWSSLTTVEIADPQQKLGSFVVWMVVPWALWKPVCTCSLAVVHQQIDLPFQPSYPGADRPSAERPGAERPGAERTGWVPALTVPDQLTVPVMQNKY